MILAGIAAVFIGMLMTIAGFLMRGQAREVIAILGMAGILVGLLLLIMLAGDAEWISEGAQQRDCSLLSHEGTASMYGAVSSTNKDLDRCESLTRARSTSSKLMDARPRLPYLKQDVDDAKQVARLLPYLAFITMFWACYGQMNNNFIIQGCQMDLRVWFGGHQMSAAFLSLFDSLVIMIFIPVFDLIIYPSIAACRGGKQLTVLQRVGSGFIFCALSMGVAGFVEVLRKRAPIIPVSPQCTSNSSFDASCRLQ